MEQSKKKEKKRKRKRENEKENRTTCHHIVLAPPPRSHSCSCTYVHVFGLSLSSFDVVSCSSVYIVIRFSRPPQFIGVYRPEIAPVSSSLPTKALRPPPLSLRKSKPQHVTYSIGASFLPQPHPRISINNETFIAPVSLP